MKKEKAGGIVSALATAVIILIGDIRILTVLLSLAVNVIPALVFSAKRTRAETLQLFFACCAVTIVTIMVATVFIFVFFLLTFKKPGG